MKPYNVPGMLKRLGGHSRQYPAILRENPNLGFASSMSLLPKLLAGLTPPPINVPEEYDGLEFRWKALTFRPACTYI